MELINQIWIESGIYQITVGQIAMLLVCLLLLAFVTVTPGSEAALGIVSAALFVGALASSIWLMNLTRVQRVDKAGQETHDNK